MMRKALHRATSPDRDRGAYAVLYAVLVVVLIGLASMVVDISALREDRRTNRAAADSAVLGGAEYLNTLALGGRQPDKACLRVWDYLRATLNIAANPVGACNNFLPGSPAFLNPTTYCQAASPALIRDERVAGDRTVIVAWPIPKGADQNFLTADVAPGNVPQDFYAKADGSDKGCDRLGVAVIQNQTFGLAAALGGKAQSTSVHSVAWFDKDGGPIDKVAALNVLNKTDCAALVTTGNGKVIVGPTVENGVVVGPGIIAVESDGKGFCTGGGKTIDPTTGSGSLICASSVILNLSGSNCDGMGQIEAYALSPQGAGNAYSAAAVSGGNLKPVPDAEDNQHGWNPVTKLFGCYSTLSPCIPPESPKPNYISDFVNALKGPGIPTTLYGDSASPYSNPYTTPFATVPTSGTNNVCPGGSGISTTVEIPAGNWYVPCSIKIASGGVLIFHGGNIVVDGAVSISSGTPNGCLVVNVPTGTTCPTAASIQNPTLNTATTNPPPTADATMFIRGNSCVGGKCGLDHAGDLVMPQTFVYAANAAQELNVNSTGLTLWTAPGAGAVDGAGRTKLEDMCTVKTNPDPTKWTINRDCMNSRFSRLVYWSDYAAPKTKPNNFAGQGSMSVVGVFFTPTAYFNFTGGGSYTATFAQFWSDSLNVNGGAFLGLAPDAKTAIESPTGAIALIR